jgi:hypothetical protein
MSLKPNYVKIKLIYMNMGFNYMKTELTYM